MAAAEPPRRADARRNRDAVLDAGAELLAVRPKASMQELADASGLGRATVYRHFATREELVGALVERVAEEVGDVIGRTVRGGDAADVPATLRRLAAEAVALGARWRFLGTIVDPEEATADVLARAGDDYAAWVRAAQARGAIVDGDPAWIASATRALVDAAVQTLDDPAAAERAAGDALVRAFAV